MQTIHKALKFRIYPNSEQQILIAKTMGSSRFVFNRFLEAWNTAYQTTGKGLSYNACSKELPGLKRTLPWLREVDSIALQSALKNLDDAFQRFFKKQNNPPTFKSKKHPVQSYTTKFTNDNIKVEEQHLQLPKLGRVKFAKSKEVNGRILSATIRKKGSGKYYVSLLVETTVDALPKTGKNCGIDVGLTDFAITSSGAKYWNPKFFRTLEESLAKEQRILARRQKFSNNWHKQRIKVSRIHERIANARDDYLHKVSTEIVKNYDIIGIEDLAVSNLLKNRKLSKCIAEASWSRFRTLLEYKAKWYGKEVIVVAKNFPSSQQCSTCGAKNKAVKDLAVRTWTCQTCGSVHHRDLNASKNLEAEALRLRTAGTAGVA